MLAGCMNSFTASLRRLVAAALLCLAATAQATPEGPRDAVVQFLQERGLIQPVAEETSAIRQARDAASELVMSAMTFLGVPYRRGGNSVESGFDCSGFTRHVFESTVGLVLPRRANEQATQGGLAKVGKEELRPGDLVFFNTMRRAFSHVGIYLGDGKFIHAPRPGAKVRVEDMRAAYWIKRFNGARRADLPADAAEGLVRDATAALEN